MIAEEIYRLNTGSSHPLVVQRLGHVHAVPGSLLRGPSTGSGVPIREVERLLVAHPLPVLWIQKIRDVEPELARKMVPGKRGYWYLHRRRSMA